MPAVHVWRLWRKREQLRHTGRMQDQMPERFQWLFTSTFSPKIPRTPDLEPVFFEAAEPKQSIYLSSTSFH